MTTEAYIRDPRFEALGCGFLWDGKFPLWVEQEKLQAYLSVIDWDNTAVLCHHAHFDGLILSHHYGFKPKMWLDTLSMARLMLGNHLSVSLQSLAEHYGLVGKSIDYLSFKGKHWNELHPSARSMLAIGCCRDVEITWQLFERLLRGERS